MPRAGCVHQWRIETATCFNAERTIDLGDPVVEEAAGGAAAGGAAAGGGGAAVYSLS